MQTASQALKTANLRMAGKYMYFLTLQACYRLGKQLAQSQLKGHLLCLELAALCLQHGRLIKRTYCAIARGRGQVISPIK